MAYVLMCALRRIGLDNQLGQRNLRHHSSQVLKDRCAGGAAAFPHQNSMASACPAATSSLARQAAPD
jgi:hypothetical protein